MIETAASSVSVESLERILRDELARGDAMAGTLVPMLRHMLANVGESIFSEEVVARVRGMLDDMARQLLDALAEADGAKERTDHDPDDIAALAHALIERGEVLRHAHALALEGQLAERLHARLALDPVLSPLIQSLISAPACEAATGAMALLAAQARFCQAWRRMKLPLAELPQNVADAVIAALCALSSGEPEAEARAARAETSLRERIRPERSRLALIERVIEEMGADASSALSVTHAGVAIFLTALAAGSGLDRDSAALTTSEAQLARLALALRASGMKPEGVAAQFVALHPDIELPPGFERLSVDRAAAILAMADRTSGD